MNDVTTMALYFVAIVIGVTILLWGLEKLTEYVAKKRFEAAEKYRAEKQEDKKDE
jgi:hypothetical protein